MRKQKLTFIGALTKAILTKLVPMVKSKLEERRRLQAVVAIDKECIDANNVIKKFEVSKEITNFSATSTACWKYTSMLQNTILCGVCDPQAAGAIDLAHDTISVGPKLLEDFGPCFEFAKYNVKTIYPLLSSIDTAVRCKNGKVTGKPVIWNIEPLKSLEDADLKAETFKELVSFGENINVNTEGSVSYVGNLVRRVSEFLKDEDEEKKDEKKEK